MKCLPKYLPLEAEAAVRRNNERDAADGVIGKMWVSEHCVRCGYEHLKEFLKMIDPVKVCCGRKESEHSGALCPNGTVWCCICFETFLPHELAEEDGNKIDVCIECYNDALSRG